MKVYIVVERCEGRTTICRCFFSESAANTYRDVLAKENQGGNSTFAVQDHVVE